MQNSLQSKPPSDLHQSDANQDEWARVCWGTDPTWLVLKGQLLFNYVAVQKYPRAFFPEFGICKVIPRKAFVANLLKNSCQTVKWISVLPFFQRKITFFLQDKCLTWKKKTCMFWNTQHFSQERSFLYGDIKYSLLQQACSLFIIPRWLLKTP